MEKIGANYLRTLRQKRGLTLKQLHEQTGLSVSSLSKLESGSMTISKESSDKLSNFYGVEIEPKKVIIKYSDDFKLEPEYRKINSELKSENKSLKNKVNELNNVISKMEREFNELLVILNKN